MGTLLYDALMLGRNKNIEKEEYLVATYQKEPADFCVEETEVLAGDIYTDTEISITLKIKTPGYLEIDFEAEDENSFVKIECQSINTNMFTDGKYVYKFRIDSERLHNGKNFSCLYIRTISKEIKIPVIINNKIKTRISDSNSRELLIKLEENYLLLKMNRTEPRQWADYSLSVLEKITGDDLNSLYLMLYKAQIYITLEEFVKAKNAIEYVAERISKIPEKDYDLIGYFIYVTSLYEKDDDKDSENETKTDQIYSLFEKHKSWKLLWMLFYMDPELSSNRKEKLAAMKAVLAETKFKTPVLYAEALNIYDARPELIEKADDFELQALNFGVKARGVTLEMAERLSDVIINLPDRKNINSKLALLVLKKLYAKFESDLCLCAIVILLSESKTHSKADHGFFEKAIRHEIKGEYALKGYFFTADKNLFREMPQAVIDFYDRNKEELSEYEAYFYACLISNKISNISAYEEHIESMVRFAEEKIAAGENNKTLAIIYRDIFDNNLITEAMKEYLIEAVCTREISGASKKMQSVAVFHTELPLYHETDFVDGLCYIKVFSGDALILFKDKEGNYYVNPAHKEDKLIGAGEYIDVCIRDVPINKYMLLKDTMPLLRAYKDPSEILDFFETNKIAGFLRPAYEQQLLKNVVNYYARTSRDENVYDRLLKFKDYELAPETRAKIIGIMIERENYEEAFEEISAYGSTYLDGDSKRKLAAYLADKYSDEENDIVLELCADCFNTTLFEEGIFSYLEKYYDEDINVLIDLYRAANAHAAEGRLLSEKIIRKAIKSGEYPEALPKIFERYYENGDDEKLKTDYLYARAKKYLEEAMSGEASKQGRKRFSFFRLFEKEMMQGFRFDDDGIIAYLIYMMDESMPDAAQIKNIELNLEDLVRRGKMLEEFKYYSRFFKLPAALSNTIIISAYSKDAPVPVISFSTKSQNRVITGNETMNEIFKDCYTFYFTLFYGEEVTFSMEGADDVTVKYEDLKIEEDDSRYFRIDTIVKLKETNDIAGMNEAARDYFVRDLITDRLF